jgi:hypothetical protein
MKKGIFVVESFDTTPPPKPENALFISFTQYQSYSKCPRSWKIKYIDKIRTEEPSIHMVFGNAMHTVIQTWLKVLFTETIKAADALAFDQMLLDELKSEYAAEVTKYKRQFSTKEELTEFYSDGLETLNYLRKNRSKYFDKKTHDIVGTEIPISISPTPDRPSVVLVGFLDIVLRSKTDKNKFYIADLKTSTKGWSKWEKEDDTKISQVLLYKQYFAKQYNVPVEEIEVEFLILRRKVDPDNAYPTPRVQKFMPTQGSITMKKAIKKFEEFINTCFTPDGYNTEISYPAVAGQNGFNCKFCEFRNNESLCPVRERLSSHV